MFTQHAQINEHLAAIRTFVKTRIEKQRDSFDPENIRNFLDLYLEQERKPESIISGSNSSIHYFSAFKNVSWDGPVWTSGLNSSSPVITCLSILMFRVRTVSSWGVFDSSNWQIYTVSCRKTGVLSWHSGFLHRYKLVSTILIVSLSVV